MAVGLLELRHWEHVRAVGLPGTTPPSAALRRQVAWSVPPACQGGAATVKTP